MNPIPPSMTPERGFAEPKPQCKHESGMITAHEGIVKCMACNEKVDGYIYIKESVLTAATERIAVLEQALDQQRTEGLLATEMLRPSHRGPGCWCPISHDVYRRNHCGTCQWIQNYRAAQEKGGERD